MKLKKFNLIFIIYKKMSLKENSENNNSIKENENLNENLSNLQNDDEKIENENENENIEIENENQNENIENENNENENNFSNQSKNNLNDINNNNQENLENEIEIQDKKSISGRESGDEEYNENHENHETHENDNEINDEENLENKSDGNKNEKSLNNYEDKDENHINNEEAYENDDNVEEENLNNDDKDNDENGNLENSNENYVNNNEELKANFENDYNIKDVSSTDEIINLNLNKVGNNGNKKVELCKEPKDLTNDEYNEVINWILSFNLEKINIKTINRDFSDGILVVKILKKCFPKFVDLHNYTKSLNSENKRNNWTTLNNKVLRKIAIDLSQKQITRIINMEKNYIEKHLIVIKSRVR